MRLFYIVTALSLIVMEFDGSSSQDVKYCVDCADFLKENCQIGRTGYSCIKFRPPNIKDVESKYTPSKTTNLSVCVPDDLTITGM